MTNHGSHADGHDGHIGHGGGGSEQAGEGHVVGVHGMLVVGAETVFLSHLPMFDHRQHDAQTILEGIFIKSSGKVRQEPTMLPNQAPSPARQATPLMVGSD